MLSSLGVSPPGPESDQTKTAVEVHEYYPDGDLLLIMPCRPQSADNQAQPSQDTHESVADILTRPVFSHFLVSSQCMILASRVFRAMLKGGFKESLELSSTGKLRLSLQDDDPDDFSILLNVLHHRTKKVPRVVTLWRLERLAILIDKYEMHESIQVFSDIWIDGLKGSRGDLPSSMTPDVLPWVFISWVFQKEEPFRQATRILLLESDSVIEQKQLQEFSLPDSVIAALQHDRCKALEEIFRKIELYVKQYQGSNTASQRICRRDKDFEALSCDAMVLGTLMKGCLKAGIWPTPSYPYSSFSVQKVAKAAAAVEVYSLCKINKDGIHAHYSSHELKRAHDQVSITLLSFKDSVQAKIKGLDLRNFKNFKGE